VSRTHLSDFQPLDGILPERTAPELLFMEARWVSLVSYELTVQALKDFLPVEETLSMSTVRTDLWPSRSDVLQSWATACAMP
jgi:hypothetical protein